MRLNELNSKQLMQFISDANSVLGQRRKIEKAASEMLNVAKKYRLDKADLEAVCNTIMSTKASNSPIAKRAKVEPKYQSKDGSKKWTGRGKSPKWVSDICKEAQITIDEFKVDKRFLIKKR